jgi:uncharacterized damage-inducible protein DinB
MNNQIFAKMALDGWNAQIKATDILLAKLSDEQLMHEVSPGRNRGIYLLGHLTAVHDLMLPLLRFEEAAYPELRPVFIDSPDRAAAELPHAEEMRARWAKVNEKLSRHFAALSPDDWFTRHASVAEEDFAKEPHRNRLNVLLSRTGHLSYHRGQLILLAPKG